MGRPSDPVEVCLPYRREGGRFPPLKATLSGLTIGSLTLTPAFDAGVLSYTATTSNATNTVTATADKPATVSIMLNGSTPVKSGEAATWNPGENTLTITVQNGDAKQVYTVTVTKS